MNDSGLMSASIYVCQKNIERLNAELAAKDRLVAANDHILAAKDAEIAQLKACRDGECERIKLGAEPCEGCHVQVANDEIEKLRALVAELADMLCFVSDEYCEENCTTTKGKMIRYCEDHPEYFCLANHYRALVAKAREVCNA